MTTPDFESSEVQLTATGRVILGMLALGVATGYDIKHFVDKTTRHFWAASYGQIYPELKRLEQQGLVRGRPEPTGGRARTVFELTDRGRAALVGWLHSDAEPLYELRDERHAEAVLLRPPAGPSNGSRTSTRCARSTSARLRSCVCSNPRPPPALRVHT